MVFGEWNQDVITQANVEGQAIVELEIVLSVKGKCFVSQIQFRGENAFAGIDLPEKETCEGAAVDCRNLDRWNLEWRWFAG